MPRRVLYTYVTSGQFSQIPAVQVIRLTQIKLPLDHPADAIKKAAALRLRVPEQHLLSCTVFRRAHDARKKSAISLVYSLDVEVKDEAAVLKRFGKDRDVGPAPDMRTAWSLARPTACPSARW